MTITMSQTDAGLAIIGGILIGISTSLHLFLKGRITGMSGIFYSIITCEKNSLFWKICLLCGMIFMVCIFYSSLQFGIIAGNSIILENPLQTINELSFVGFGLSGFLVGFGTKLGNGCTSGHGVCGLPRWSPRSWVAVPTFMSTGMVISTIKYYLPFLNETQGDNVIQDINYDASIYTCLTLSIILFITILVKSLFIDKNKDSFYTQIIAFIVGLIFAMGLGFGGMLQRKKIIGFLTFNNNWDPQLLILFISAVGFNILSFYIILKQNEKPLLEKIFDIPKNRTIDYKLIIGATVFGIGWGLGGLCPGPAMCFLPIFTPHILLVYIPFLALGQISAVYFDKQIEKSIKKTHPIINQKNIEIQQLNQANSVNNSMSGNLSNKK